MSPCTASQPAAMRGTREQIQRTGRKHETTGERGAAGRWDRAGYLRCARHVCGRGDERDRDAQRHHRVRGRAGDEQPDGHQQRGARQGVFRGVGRVVELVPPDPATGVSRDDLVFRGGTMHVVSTAGTLLSFSVNPHSCLFTGTQQFTWDVTGGTGQFDDATGSFTGTVSAVALLARNPDGSCSLTPLPFPRLEVDKFAESGTLSF